MAKIKCPNCGTKYTGNFCPSCASPAPEQPPKKKKKWLLPVLIGLAIVLVVACTAGGGSETRQPSDVDGDDSVSGTIASGTAGTSGATASEEVTIAEAELYNKNGIVVTATGLDNGLFGPEVTINVVNDSQQNILVSARDVSVNGYMMSTASLYCTVAAGKKANDELLIFTSELEEAGIETIADVELYLRISDSDSYTEIDTSELLSVHTSAYGTFTQPVDDSGDLVYDKNGVRVVCKGLQQDLIWDGTVVFYVENNSSQPVILQAENVSVNGYMVDVGLWSELRAGTRIVDGMYILDLDGIDLDGIDGVEEIEFTLRLSDGDSWGEIDTTDAITLTFGE